MAGAKTDRRSVPEPSTGNMRHHVRPSLRKSYRAIRRTAWPAPRKAKQRTAVGAVTVHVVLEMNDWIFLNDISRLMGKILILAYLIRPKPNNLRAMPYRTLVGKRIP